MSRRALPPWTWLLLPAASLGLGLLLAFLPLGDEPEPLVVVPGNEQGVAVHVVGAVARPGLVTLPVGSRVMDAVTAAGGPTAEADLQALNLAQPLLDGQQVRVPARGEGTGAVTPDGLIDLNHASAELLETLPGIGPVRAAAIVESRQRDGPFRSPEELLSRDLVPSSVYEAIRDVVGVQ